MALRWIIHILILTFISCTPGDREDEAVGIETTEEESIHNDIPDSLSLTESILRQINDPKLEQLKKKLNKINFEDSVRSIYNEIGLSDTGLSYRVFRFAFLGFLNLKNEGKLSDRNLLSIIDFTQSSCNKRFYTIDLDTHEMIFNTYVSHGRASGGDKPTKFGNREGSFQSSIGFYVTSETYTGSKGYSLRLEGMEKGYNENLRKRAVVMHDADYVSEAWIKRYGRLGRSQGCPALPKNISKKIINTIKDQTAIFAYYNDQKYIRASNYLNLEKLMDKWEDEG